jgi:hypothetical protein
MAGYIDDNEDDQPVDRVVRSDRWAGALGVLSMVAILIVCGNFVSPFKNNAIGVTYFVFFATIYIQSEYRRNTWFWAALGLLLIVHVLIIVFVDVPLPPGPAMAYVVPAFFIDGFFVFVTVNLIGKSIAERSRARS